VRLSLGSRRFKFAVSALDRRDAAPIDGAMASDRRAAEAVLAGLAH